MEGKPLFQGYENLFNTEFKVHSSRKIRLMKMLDPEPNGVSVVKKHQRYKTNQLFNTLQKNATARTINFYIIAVF